MAYFMPQFRGLIDRTLSTLDPALADPAAINLLLGTAAQESGFGTYLAQKTGPALGCFQMEPATFEWLQVHFEDEYPILKGRKAEEMEYDLQLAIIMARLRYRVSVHPLPTNPDDVEGLATAWKLIYNTIHGAGTVEQFVKNYHRFVV